MCLKFRVEVVDILDTFISISNIRANVVDTQTSLDTAILQVYEMVRQMSAWGIKIEMFTKLQSLYGNEQVQDIWSLYQEKCAKLRAFMERFKQTTDSFEICMEELLGTESLNADVFAVMSPEERLEAVKQWKKREKLTLEWKLKIDELNDEWNTTIKVEVVSSTLACLKKMKLTSINKK